MDVSIEYPGSVHDARVFTNSKIHDMLKNKVIPPCEREILTGYPKVPICLLGDAAYPLLPFLMKEYPGGGAQIEQKFLSHRISSSRMVVECAFGRMKLKFRCLQRVMDINLHDLPAVIYTCCVLHNFLICKVDSDYTENSIK